MTSRTKKLLAASAAVLVLATVGVSWWRWLAVDQEMVEEARPPIPDLSSAREPARAAIAAADARARSFFTARKGLVELSRLYHANGFFEEAARCYEGLEELEPTEPRWMHRHAIILAGYGEIEPAIALWRRVIVLAPDYEPARLRLGDSLLKQNRLAEAAEVYAEVQRRNPSSDYALLGLARIDLEEKRWDQARARLETLVARTNYALGYDLIVSLYEQIGEQQRAAAIRGAQKASGAYRDPADPWVDGLLDWCYDPYRLSLAAGLMPPMAYEQAARMLERAISLAPDDVGCRFQLGMLRLQQKKFDAARQQFESCTTISPGFPDGWFQLSLLEAKLGESVASDQTLAQGLRQCPQSPGLHLLRARNLKQAGRNAEAITEYRTSIALRPNEADAYIELGSLLIGIGRPEEGIEQVQAALHAEPGNPIALSTLAFNAIMQGDEPEARQWLARAKAQPRVAADQLAQLNEAFRRQFGRLP